MIPDKSPHESIRDVVTCPSCQHEVGAKLPICPFCGNLMSSKTTIIVPDKPKTGMNHIQQVSQLIKEHGNALVLYFSEFNQNVVLKTDGVIILGRASPDTDDKPLLDLLPFGAQKKGVSRHHAEISYVESEREYLIRDLGSTNGTYVNEVKLTPNVPAKLQNGNTIRLGQLLVFAYFSLEGDIKTSTEPVEINAVDATLYLVERAEISGDTPMRRLTPEYIRTTLLPYLEAMFGAQSVYHNVKGNKLVKPGIVSIQIAEKYKIAVKVKDCDEIIRFMGERIMSWRKQHADRLIMWHDRLDADPQDDPELLSNALVQLAKELLQFATGDLTINHDTSLIDGLTPHMRVLMLSKYDVAL